MDSLAEGVQRYSSNWYQIDQLHRKFTYHVRMSGQASLMGSLTGAASKTSYSNNYLLKLGGRFPGLMASKWEAFRCTSRRIFFEHWVRLFRRRTTRFARIISPMPCATRLATSC